MNQENKRKTGSKYEALAVYFLEESGYQILDRNVYTHYGELDIVAYAPKEETGEWPLPTLVFLEVKYRTSKRYGDPLEAITKRKLMHMTRSAMAYIKMNGLSMNQPMRFDAIGIEADGTIRHVKNIVN